MALCSQPETGCLGAWPASRCPERQGSGLRAEPALWVCLPPSQETEADRHSTKTSMASTAAEALPRSDDEFHPARSAASESIGPAPPVTVVIY